MYKQAIVNNLIKIAKINILNATGAAVGAEIGGTAGYAGSNWLSKKLGLKGKKGWRRAGDIALRTLGTAGGAALGGYGGYLGGDALHNKYYGSNTTNTNSAEVPSVNATPNAGPSVATASTVPSTGVTETGVHKLLEPPKGNGGVNQAAIEAVRKAVADGTYDVRNYIDLNSPRGQELAAVLKQLDWDISDLKPEEVGRIWGGKEPMRRIFHKYLY